MLAARSSDSEKQRRKVGPPPPRLSPWNSERYLPCKDLDISLHALITSWNMNKSAGSGEEPRRAFVKRYWLILRGKDWRSRGPGEGHGGATRYWSAVNLVKRSCPLAPTGWGASSMVIREAVISLSKQESSLKRNSHVSQKMLDSWIDIWKQQWWRYCCETGTEIFEKMAAMHRSTTLKDWNNKGLITAKQKRDFLRLCGNFILTWSDLLCNYSPCVVL